MKDQFYSYLDSFDSITIIIPKESYDYQDSYYLEGNDESIELKIKEIINIGDEEKLIVNFDAYLRLELPYHVVTNSGKRSFLRMGRIHRDPLFDSIYHYKRDDLGVTFTKESSKFKIWAPTAKGVTLELISPNGDKESYKMEYRSLGVYRCEISGNYDSYKYRFKVNVNGKAVNVVDPYAVSSDGDQKYGFIIDKSRLYKMRRPMVDRNFKSNDMIIYETSIRDFTSFFKDSIERSTFKGFVDTYTKGVTAKPNGFQYLKKLGVTHIQLMPFFTFAEVNEKDRFKRYNWGYNPVLYNSPSGVFTNNPDDPYEKINNLRYMIDEIHKAGMKVVMDVVYNHVYDAESYPMALTCPGYMFRYNREEMRTNYSGCGNDVNTSKNMVRKFIVDSLKYWAIDYMIDGFRFDLMGLIDFETMNDIRNELKYINPNIVLYGEGWNMIPGNLSDYMAHMYNRNVMHEIAFFNDKYRNVVKDYLSGYDVNKEELKNVILGSSIEKFLFKYPHQSVNYIECHDNYTLYDDLRQRRVDLLSTEIEKLSNVGIAMVILSLGIPFLHSGMELHRTKNGIENSYKSKDSVNMIDWSKVNEYQDDIDNLKKLIKIRNKYDLFKSDRRQEIKGISKIDFTIMNTIKYNLFDKNNDLMMVFKIKEDKETIGLADYKPLVSNIKYDKETGIAEGIGFMVMVRG